MTCPYCRNRLAADCYKHVISCHLAAKSQRKESRKVEDALLSNLERQYSEPGNMPKPSYSEAL
jgi:hypothetical protein